MAEQPASLAGIPTAMQQRIGWRPVKRTAFRQLTHFRALFNVYCLATGKRYRRVDNGRAEARFFCCECGVGRCSLRIRRTSAASWWIVRTVVECDCGTPPVALLEALGSNDRSALVGQRVPNKSDWRLLACACFPRGYVCDRRKSSRRWCISCKGKNCGGQLNTELEYVRGGRKYDAFRILSAVDCSEQCKRDGGPGFVIPVRTHQWDEEACPLCYEDELDEWVRFPCGQQTCRDCLEKLVQSCPSEIAKGSNLSRFEPERNEAHRHTCPFCKVAYAPRTRVQHRVRGNTITVREVEVRDLVATPYGYQSFDAGAPAHLATEADYRAMEIQYNAYLRTVRADRLREAEADAQRGGLPRDELLALLNATTYYGYERLQVLRQSGHFLRHRHMVLNFIEALEVLYEQGLDGGFLQHVASAQYENQRGALVREAYEIGWGGEDDINSHLIMNLLQRNKLVEVIDLVSSDDGGGGDYEDSDDDYTDNETANV